MNFKCLKCGKIFPLDTLKYKCSCGALFTVDKQIKKFNYSVSLGEIQTPILKRNIAGIDMFLKLDYMMPTGSF